MQKINRLFLEALRASLNRAQVNWRSEEVSLEEMNQIFSMAAIHKIFPMIFEAVYRCAAMAELPPDYMMRQRGAALYQISLQIRKTAEFKDLVDYLRKEGLAPCVVKGVICRDLYPDPDARSSGDEDLFLAADQMEKVHASLLAYGMELSRPDMDIEASYEVAYGKSKSPLYIEVHRDLFPPESEAYGNLNRFFDGIFRSAEKLRRDSSIHQGECGLIETEIDGTKFLTLNATDHLLYLILHAFKHFLHSGFGIRQVCDINLYAMAYGEGIDWEYLLRCLQEVRADLFAAAIFAIGEKYLIFDAKRANYPASWRSMEVDETDMLEDLLNSGVYGQSDMSRKHSSNITLNAVIADRRGQVAKTGGFYAAVRAVCLPAHKLSDRYPYLKKLPFLLPLAWISRVLAYRKETAGRLLDNNAADSIRIGNERVELMRKYGIIKGGDDR